MNFLPQSLKNALLLILCCLAADASTLFADMVATPVSVGFPYAGVTPNVNGNVTSQPISVGFPYAGVTPNVNGNVSSQPVSVGFPYAGATPNVNGNVASAPVSVGFPYAGVTPNVNGNVSAQPVSVGFAQANALDADLVGLWHMDGDWGDASGNNNHGIPSNTPTFSADRKIGLQSGSFNGASQYIEVKNSASLNPSQITVSVWAKSNTALWNNYGFLVSKRNAYLLNPTSGTNQIAFNINPESENARIATDNDMSFDITTWHQYVGTYDGSSLKIYVDGVLKNSITTSVAINTLDTGSLFFAWDDGYAGRYFNGLIDDVAIYKRALTAEEIAVRYANGGGDASSPEPPTLNPVPSFVGTNTVTLSGTKPAGSSIWVNDKKIVAADTATDWQGSYGTLQLGVNILKVAVLDAANHASQPAVRTVFYDNVAPLFVGSRPAHNSNTAKAVTSVAIDLYDANAGVDLNGSTHGATVKNSAGELIAGSWTTSGTGTIVFTPSAPFPADTYTVTVYPVDAAGNIAQQQQVVFTNHDITPPTTQAALSGTKGTDDWYSTPVTVTFTSVDGDSGSGTAGIEYSFDSSTWQAYSGPFVMDADGIHSLYFRSIDMAGNVESPAKSQQVKINQTGLVGMWHMDGGWSDSSLAGNNGTSYGANFSSDAKIGTFSGGFNGSNGYVSVSDSKTIQLTSAMTLVAWIRPNDVGNYQQIISKFGAPWGYGYQIGLAPTGQIRSDISMDGTTYDALGSSNSPITAAAWQLVAATFDKGSWKLYVNGVEAASKTSTVTTLKTSSTPLNVGRSPEGIQYFNGLIDEASVYNRALSAAEIQRLYSDYLVGLPTVDPVVSPTASDSIIISGTKPADTAIVVNGNVLVPLDASTTWQAAYTLVPGVNNLSVTALDTQGFNSLPATLTVALDIAPPQVTATTPTNSAVIRNAPNSITLTLKDDFSTIDANATVAGATVTSAGGEVAGTWSSFISGTSGTVTFTPTSPFTEGSYQVRFSPTDALGTGAAYTLDFTIDTTPPAAPGIDSLPQVTNTSSRTVTGTKSSDSVSVAVTCSGATVGAVTYQNATTWSVNISGLAEGEKTVTASARDAAGNQSASTSAGFTVDLTAPAKPVLDAVSSPTASSSVTLTGTKEANSSLYANGQPVAAAGFAATTWSYQASLAEGSNTFTFYAKDAATNQGGSSSVTVVRDTAAPTLASSSPAANAVVNDPSAVTVTLTDGATGSGVNLDACRSAAVMKNAAGAVVDGAWAVSGNALVFTPASVQSLADGKYTVTVGTSDLLGNGTGTASFSFTLDRTAPSVQTLALSPASPVKAGSVSFTLTFGEPMLTSVQPAVTFTRGLFFSTYAVAGGTWLDSKTWRGSYTMSADTGDGSYTVSASGAKDLAGNVLSSQTAGTFVLMTAQPATPTLAAPTTPTKQITQLLAGTKPANTALAINNVVRVPLGPATDWSYNYPLAEGVNTLAVVARDAAGNDSAAITPPPAITLDTTPPLFTVDSYQSPAPAVTQTISGKKEPGCVVKLAGATVIEATDVASTWSLPVTLVDGISNRLVFTATDELGNTTTKTLDILCDTAPPQPLATGMLVADGSGKGNEVSLSWPSYQEPLGLAYYRVYVATADFAAVTGLTPAGTVNKGTRIFKATGLTLGTRYYFAVIPVSASGNSDTTFHTANAVPVDTLPPEDVTGITAAAGYGAAEGNMVTLSWSASADSMGDLADQVLYLDAGQGYDAGAALGKAAHSYTKNGLNDATVYKFKVATKDALNHESSGAVVTAVTRLANPTGLTAVPGTGKATLSWNAVASSYLKQYNIYRAASAAQQTSTAGMTLVKSQSGTSFTDTGLSDGTTYQYAVTTVNSSGAERTDAQSIAVTPRSDATGPVLEGINLTANQVVTAPLTVTAAATDSESAISRMEIWIDGSLATTQNAASVSYAWNVVNATDGNHTVKIAAYDAPGNATERTIPVVVSLAPPAAPVITSTFSTSIASRNVAIEGTAQAGATLSLKVNGVVAATMQAPNATFTFASVALAEGDNYVAVKAANRGGESPFSAEMKITSVTTLPVAPVGLAAKALPGGSLQFTWQGGGSGAVGYNLYAASASFTSVSDSGVTKTNGSLIPYLLKEYLPASDNTGWYAVTAVDGAGNESPVSNVITIASDRSAPTATAVVFADSNGTAAADNVYGPGSVTVGLTVSEPLSEAPFLSLEPHNASPILIALQKTDDTHYAGNFTVDAASAQGGTVWKFSGKDVTGNRGSGQGTGPTLDVKGPVATLTEPVALVKTIAGPVRISFSLDERSLSTPAVSLKSYDGITAESADLATSDGGVHWSGTLDPSALSEGKGQVLVANARDRFGNVGSTGADILLYKVSPPAAGIPQGLTAKAGKAGTVSLSWSNVGDAQGYNIYRQVADDAAPVLVAGIDTGTAVTYTDTPPVDGVYSFSVSSVGYLGVESARSEAVSATSDRTPPASPTGLALTLSGNGVLATWDTSLAPAEVPYSYRLYRAESVIADLAGMTAVALVKAASATDPAPTIAKRFYAVTALDALGNESAASGTVELNFPVAPVGTLTLSSIDEGAPVLEWNGGEAGQQGFNIYRNGIKINPTPTISKSFTDGYYTKGSVTYGISAVSALGVESPVREVTLPQLNIGLADGTAMRRGLLENVKLVASLPDQTLPDLSIDSVSLKIGNLAESSEDGPFVVTAAQPVEIAKVAATEAGAPTQEAVVVTAVMHPAPGTTVKLTRSSLTAVLGSSSALEVFNEPLIRGTTGSARIKINNLGSADLSFLTSENGGASSQVVIYLKDEDGNLLAQGNLNQRTGDVVNSGSYATARIQPGGSFLSDPITFAIPVTAPYKVLLEAVVVNTYYHYGQSDQVVAPGLSQSVDSMLADVSYMASATTDRQTYKQGSGVVISGQAVSASTGTPMEFVPVKIGVSVSGFDRFYTVNTDSAGNFSYTFTPGANETGSYSVWASHPDLTGRSVQARFSILGLGISPTVANVTVLKGKFLDIPVAVTNLSPSPLTGVAFTPSFSNGVGASVLNGGSTVLAAGERRSLTLRLSADAGAPDLGFASLAVTTAEGPEDRMEVNVTSESAIPKITATPSYIDTGLVRGTQRIASFAISNTGMGTLNNARIDGPSLPWLSLTVAPTLGNIPTGQSNNIGILISPDDTIPQGVYNDRLVIYSDNHVPYTYNIQVTVTSSAVGSVQFSLLDELMKDVPGATITLQNQALPELFYTLQTAADGTASLFDIPEGRYSYNVSAAGHKPYSGSFTITPGVTATVPVGLEVTLVQVEWSVTPVVIEDRYQVTVTQTFATNVPTAVVVTEPPNINLPDIKEGEVFNGEFTITNYGLIAANYDGIKFAPSFDDYDLEVLANIPAKIGANQKITIPYRITRRQQTAARNGDGTSDLARACGEVGGYGGGSCSGGGSITTSWSYVICPGALNERTVTSTSTHTVSWNRCTGGGGTGGGGTSPTPTYGSTSGQGGQSSGGSPAPSGTASVTGLSGGGGDEECIYPRRPNEPPTCHSSAGKF